MATVAFTFNWRVTARRDSLVDFEFYVYDLAATASKQEAQEVAAAVKGLGYVQVKVVPNTSLP
jgi:hypothetical protein